MSQLSVSDIVTIPQAVREYGLQLSRLRGWRRRGLLKPVGRLRGNVVNGGELVFRRIDIEMLINDPPRRGRPSREALPVIDVDVGGGA